jgi:hypothetical protein
MNAPRIGQASIVLHWVSRFALWVLGWKVQGPRPPFERYVAIFGPHTSYWDAPIAIFMSFVLRVKGNWLGKHTIFRWPFGYLFRAIGGIPVERSAHHNFVDEAVRVFAENERIILALAPEGTRKCTDHWKSGFYHIAVQAKVPIVLAFFDFERKLTGNTGVVLYPTGDILADLERIREVYDAITPRHPERRSAVRFRESTPPARPEE